MVTEVFEPEEFGGNNVSNGLINQQNTLRAEEKELSTEEKELSHQKTNEKVQDIWQETI